MGYFEKEIPLNENFSRIFFVNGFTLVTSKYFAPFFLAISIVFATIKGLFSYALKSCPLEPSKVDFE